MSRESDLYLIDKTAREVSAWFEYTTGPMPNEHLGQCGDYDLRFVLQYNKLIDANEARLVVANNPIPSGTYKVIGKVDAGNIGLPDLGWDRSGFVIWNNFYYLYHPIIGLYEISLERAWIPKTHFGVDMLNPKEIHVWASVGEVSVDPTYIDILPERFSSPLGIDF